MGNYVGEVGVEVGAVVRVGGWQGAGGVEFKLVRISGWYVCRDSGDGWAGLFPEQMTLLKALPSWENSPRCARPDKAGSGPRLADTCALILLQ